MSPPEDQAQQKWQRRFESYHAELLRFLRRAFPRLRDEAKDVLQDVFAEALQRNPEGENLRSWLYTAVRHRALDRLRRWERRAFEQLALSQGSSSGSSRSSDTAPAAKAPGPSTQALEAERRGRQGILLSQVLEEFVRWCEKRPGRLRIKEAYERALRGEPPARIAQAMQVPREQIYEWLRQARSWVYQRIRHEDVEGSVFLTLHRVKPD